MSEKDEIFEVQSVAGTKCPVQKVVIREAIDDLQGGA